MAGETNQTVEQEKGNESIEWVTAGFGESYPSGSENGQNSANHVEATLSNPESSSGKFLEQEGTLYPSGSENPKAQAIPYGKNQKIANFVGGNINQNTGGIELSGSVANKDISQDTTNTNTGSDTSAKDKSGSNVLGRIAEFAVALFGKKKDTNLVNQKNTKER